MQTATTIFPGVSPIVKELPRALEELVNYAAGIGYAVIIQEVPKMDSPFREKDAAGILEEFLKASAESAGALARGDSGRNVAGPALQAAISAYRLAQYAMLLEDHRLKFAASQPQ